MSEGGPRAQGRKEIDLEPSPIEEASPITPLQGPPRIRQGYCVVGETGGGAYDPEDPVLVKDSPLVPHAVLRPGSSRAVVVRHDQPQENIHRTTRYEVTQSRMIYWEIESIFPITCVDVRNHMGFRGPPVVGRQEHGTLIPEGLDSMYKMIDDPELRPKQFRTAKVDEGSQRFYLEVRDDEFPERPGVVYREWSIGRDNYNVWHQAQEDYAGPTAMDGWARYVDRPVGWSQTFDVKSLLYYFPMPDLPVTLTEAETLDISDPSLMAEFCKHYPPWANRPASNLMNKIKAAGLAMAWSHIPSPMASKTCFRNLLDDAFSDGVPGALLPLPNVGDYLGLQTGTFDCVAKQIRKLKANSQADPLMLFGGDPIAKNTSYGRMLGGRGASWPINQMHPTPTQNAIKERNTYGTTSNDWMPMQVGMLFLRHGRITDCKKKQCMVVPIHEMKQPQLSFPNGTLYQDLNYLHHWYFSPALHLAYHTALMAWLPYVDIEDTPSDCRKYVFRAERLQTLRWNDTLYFLCPMPSEVFQHLAVWMESNNENPKFRPLAMHIDTLRSGSVTGYKFELQDIQEWRKEQNSWRVPVSRSCKTIAQFTQVLDFGDEEAYWHLAGWDQRTSCMCVPQTIDMNWIQEHVAKLAGKGDRKKNSDVVSFINKTGEPMVIIESQCFYPCAFPDCDLLGRAPYGPYFNAEERARIGLDAPYFVAEGIPTAYRKAWTTPTPPFGEERIWGVEGCILADCSLPGRMLGYHTQSEAFFFRFRMATTDSKDPEKYSSVAVSIRDRVSREVLEAGRIRRQQVFDRWESQKTGSETDAPSISLDPFCGTARKHSLMETHGPGIGTYEEPDLPPVGTSGDERSEYQMSKMAYKRSLIKSLQPGNPVEKIRDADVVPHLKRMLRKNSHSPVLDPTRAPVTKVLSDGEVITVPKAPTSKPPILGEAASSAEAPRQAEGGDPPWKAPAPMVYPGTSLRKTIPPVPKFTETSAASTQLSTRGRFNKNAERTADLMKPKEETSDEDLPPLPRMAPAGPAASPLRPIQSGSASTRAKSGSRRRREAPKPGSAQRIPMKSVPEDSCAEEQDPDGGGYDDAPETDAQTSIEIRTAAGVRRCLLMPKMAPMCPPPATTTVCPPPTSTQSMPSSGRVSDVLGHSDAPSETDMSETNEDNARISLPGSDVESIADGRHQLTREQRIVREYVTTWREELQHLCTTGYRPRMICDIQPGLEMKLWGTHLDAVRDACQGNFKTTDGLYVGTLKNCRFIIEQQDLSMPHVYAVRELVDVKHRRDERLDSAKIGYVCFLRAWVEHNFILVHEKKPGVVEDDAWHASTLDSGERGEMFEHQCNTALDQLKTKVAVRNMIQLATNHKELCDNMSPGGEPMLLSLFVKMKQSLTLSNKISPALLRHYVQIKDFEDDYEVLMNALADDANFVGLESKDQKTCAKLKNPRKAEVARKRPFEPGPVATANESRLRKTGSAASSDGYGLF